MNQFLFISYTGLLTGLCRGRISAAKLDQGLFYFGCSKEAFLHGGLPGGAAPEEIRETALAHMRLEQALLRAEAEQRVEWRPEHGKPNYAQLNQLLVKNGLKALESREYYAYPEVRSQMSSANPQTLVFY